MTDRIRYTVENGIVRITLAGKTSPDELSDVTTEIANKHQKTIPHIRIILDVRRASFFGKPEDLKVIVKKFREHHNKFDLIKLAIVLQNPYETAISIIFQKMARDISNLLINVFSTEQAALLWLT